MLHRSSIIYWMVEDIILQDRNKLLVGIPYQNQSYISWIGFCWGILVMMLTAYSWHGISCHNLLCHRQNKVVPHGHMVYVVCTWMSGIKNYDYKLGVNKTECHMAWSFGPDSLFTFCILDFAQTRSNRW